MKQNPLVGITKLLVDFMFYAGIAVTVAVPFIVKFTGRYLELIHDNQEIYTVIFTVAGVMALFVLWNLKHMLKTVVQGDPFVQENVSALKRMGVCSFAIALVMGIRVLFVLTVTALVLTFVFIIAGLFSLVLSQVFERAVNYKQENDLTI